VTTTLVMMPEQKRNLTTLIRNMIVIAFMLIGGAYFVYIAAQSFFTDHAITIGDDSSWMSRSDYPAFFWFSIVFHASSGAFAILNGARMVMRLLNLTGRSK
jgi:hypothetical protein